ncbi:hypothetical protein ERICIV_02163 [Paenibacillus larvae subsp. larvae]|uniref:Uncharacterized protein n=1 Tax=Paenibacillus larvae subsp. larvae TaxID=147375 RepID=A0A2L1UDR5_9BACL|nr:hypothetical protein ERICIII_02142 [Paenibacillus larvae subsp. larvae]AVF31080.1 hypothetical protein ERICIV_02163 [Paenibacillus larvae subsp. larvae]
MNLYFRDVLTEEKEVRELIGESSEVIKRKSIQYRFILP